VPERRLRAKNGKLHGGILFVVRDRKKQRVPIKSRSAIDGDDRKRHDRFFELVSDARDRSRPALELDPAAAGIVRLSMRTLSTDMKN
jgi:hypothetical protein